ncbi:hypothetical protein CK203_077265 [Vitis vinifera]|uniref:Uncharacterized protein n=1 Tax=Vitis vinifera TaxID=29760 RepID=A0A438BU33_VITVI|nr:hypothetical protein CK203_077265 [Vitis vinifera]
MMNNSTIINAKREFTITFSTAFSASNLFLHWHHAQKRSRNGQFHLIGFLFYDLGLSLVGQPLQTRADRLLPILLLQDGTPSEPRKSASMRLHPERENPKIWSNTPARVNGSSRHCSADTSRRKMRCYILTWMNTEMIDNKGRQKRNHGSQRESLQTSIFQYLL